MTKFIKLSTAMAAVLAILAISLQSCCEDKHEVKVYYPPTFKATNGSVTAEPVLSASGNTVVVNVSYSVTITINGESCVVSGTRRSDELPVLAGNEVEIMASFNEDSATSYISFSMPDGSRKLVSKTDPACRWTVPTNFNEGDKIVAQWADNAGKIKYEELKSSITLIELK